MLRLNCSNLIQNQEENIDNINEIYAMFHRFTIIEYSLDPENHHSIIEQLQHLRRDFSKVFWFKHLCTVDPESVYERLVMGSKKIKSSKEVGKHLIEVLKMALQDEANITSKYYITRRTYLYK